MNCVTACLVLALLGCTSPAVAIPRTPSGSESIAVRNAWVRVSTSQRRTSSGYCRIENHTDRPVVLVRITAKDVGDAQVHTVETHDGQSSMRAIPKLTIPPHGVITLEPGGTHIMLTEIAHPLTIGAKVEMRLTFDNGRTEIVQAIVRPLDAMSIR